MPRLALEIVLHQGTVLLQLIPRAVAIAPLALGVEGVGVTPHPARRIVVVIVIHLAGRDRDVAVVAEQLRKGDGAGRNMPADPAGPPDAFGTVARQHAGTRRHAERKLAIRPLEQQPLAGKPVQVGRLDLRVAVAPEIGTQVVHNDEQHVGLAGWPSGSDGLRGAAGENTNRAECYGGDSRVQ